MACNEKSYFKKEIMRLLTKKQQESYEHAKICCICKKKKKKIENKYLTDKKYCKVRYHFHYTRQYRGAAHSICNIK